MENGNDIKDYGKFAEEYQQLKFVLDENTLCAFIACFFHKNPRAMDTLEGLTVWCFKRNPQGVKEALVQLQMLGIVEEIRMGETKLYSYTKNPRTRQMLDGYFQAMEKEGRSPFSNGSNLRVDSVKVPAKK